MDNKEFTRLTMRHGQLAEKLCNATSRYAGFVSDVNTLECHLGNEHEAVQTACENLDKRLRGCQEDVMKILLPRGQGKLEASNVLAASPAFAGPATRPYRIVLLQLYDDSFSVHRMYLDELGGFDDGNYFPKKEDYSKAMDRWMRRTTAEIIERGPACYDFRPLP